MLALVAVLYLGACAATKDFAATGGSRADGTVDLSYEYGLFQVPHEDQVQGGTLATSKCAAWGYSGAEPFGGETRICSVPTNSGCARFLVTRKYQCTANSPSPLTSNTVTPSPA